MPPYPSWSRSSYRPHRAGGVNGVNAGSHGVLANPSDRMARNPAWSGSLLGPDSMREMTASHVGQSERWAATASSSGSEREPSWKARSCASDGQAIISHSVGKPTDGHSWAFGHLPCTIARAGCHLRGSHMAADRPPTSLTLLHRLRANEPDAWARMVGLYRPLVCYWCGRQGLFGDDADDIAQEVFQVAAARLADFRRDRPGDTFRGWLRGITRIKVWEHLKDRGQQPPAVGGSTALNRLQGVADEPQESDAADEDPPSEIAGLLRRALELVRAEFEPATWRAFLLTAVDGKPAPEAAAELGLTAAAVRQAKSRVLRRVRQELGDLPD